jgi:glutamate--cysteine ligase
MSNPGEIDATPIASKAALAAHFAAGCKPRAEFRIGTEHEKFGFRSADLLPPPYAPDGIGALLEGIAAQDTAGWTRIDDDGALIGLSRDGASISLEPAGQFELSGAPLASLHDTAAEMATHFRDVAQAADPLGITFAALGFHPFATREMMPWMPKGRYAIMRRYMPLVGGLGLDMMLRTCTVQVNLDFESEADMVRKLRTALLLQPLATALFANSPFTEGRPNGLLSMRAKIWTDTDPDRTGIPDVMFEDGFGFERYVEWLLDVPMYFIHRNGAYVDLAGESFRAFMAGNLAARPGEAATMGDFSDHMTTAFTDVRLKRFLEMRGADAGRPDMMVAQSALWVGLLYDPASLEAAFKLVSRHPWQEFAALRAQVPALAMNTPWQGGTLRDLGREVLAIANDGLRARGLRNAAGHDETIFLAPLHEIVAGGPTQAEYWLSRYEKAWGGDVHRIVNEAAIGTPAIGSFLNV